MVSLSRTLCLGLFLAALGLVFGPSHPIERISAKAGEQAQSAEDQQKVYQEAAYWTGWIQAGSGALGIIGLFATVLYARRAWREAQVSAVAANKTLEHSERVAAMQLRPWVSISLKPLSAARADYGSAFKFDLLFENLGSTVAQAFYVEYEMMFEGERTLELVQKWRERTRKEWVPFREKIHSAVMPGERIAYTLRCSYSDDIIPWTADGLNRVSVVPPITALAFYRSEDGSWHETARSFNFGQVGLGAEHERIFKDTPNLSADDFIVTNRGGSYAT